MPDHFHPGLVLAAAGAVLALDLRLAWHARGHLRVGVAWWGLGASLLAALAWWLYPPGEGLVQGTPVVGQELAAHLGPWGNAALATALGLGGLGLLGAWLAHGVGAGPAGAVAVLLVACSPLALRLLTADARGALALDALLGAAWALQAWLATRHAAWLGWLWLAALAWLAAGGLEWLAPLAGLVVLAAWRWRLSLAASEDGLGTGARRAALAGLLAAGGLAAAALAVRGAAAAFLACDGTVLRFDPAAIRDSLQARTLNLALSPAQLHPLVLTAWLAWLARAAFTRRWAQAALAMAGLAPGLALALLEAPGHQAPREVLAANTPAVPVLLLLAGLWLAWLAGLLDLHRRSTRVMLAVALAMLVHAQWMAEKVIGGSVF